MNYTAVKACALCWQNALTYLFLLFLDLSLQTLRWMLKTKEWALPKQGGWCLSALVHRPLFGQARCRPEQGLCFASKRYALRWTRFALCFKLRSLYPIRDSYPSKITSMSYHAVSLSSRYATGRTNGATESLKIPSHISLIFESMCPVCPVLVPTSWLRSALCNCSVCKVIEMYEIWHAV